MLLDAMTPRHRHYRAPTKPLATAWARHLDAVMRERDLSQTNVFDAVREEMGYATTSRSALLRVFSDKEPDARLAEVLARHYGAPVAGVQPPTPEELSLQERAVVAAERQADLMAELVAELRSAREDRERLARLEATVDTLVAGVLAPGGTRAPGAHASPRP